jgi:colicin import membrane protein
MSSFAREYSSGLTVSIVGHGLLLMLFAMNLVLMPAAPIAPVKLAIEASVIDFGEIRRREEAEQQRQQQKIADAARQKEAEQKKQAVDQARNDEQKRKAEAEQKRQAVVKQQQALKQQQAEKEQAEKQRQAAEKKRRAEEVRVAEQKKRAEEARVAEQKRQAEAARQAREAEMQANMRSELEAEERRMAAINSGALAQYADLVNAAVSRQWIEPASAKQGIECEVIVTQAPGGVVRSVRIGKCDGDAAVKRSIEAAVSKASPLPRPPDPSLFERNLVFIFKPKQ